jgi:hypothetical protein
MIFEVVVFADENASIVVQPTAKVLTHTIYRKSLCRRPGKKKPSPAQPGQRMHSRRKADRTNAEFPTFSICVSTRGVPNENLRLTWSNQIFAIV